MKKHSFLMLLCIAVATSSYAQITVDSKGRVLIGDTTTVQKTTIRPQVGLGNKATIFANGYFYNVLSVHSKSLAQWGPAIHATADYVNDRQVAIMAYATNVQPYNSGRSYGILAAAGNRTPGYNYGIYGILEGSNYNRQNERCTFCKTKGARKIQTIYKQKRTLNRCPLLLFRGAF